MPAEARPAAPAAASVSKLETTEITRHFSDASPSKTEGRKTAEALRARLLERLDQEDETELQRQLEKCGSVVELICTGCGNSRGVELSCKRRWCPVCARAISARRQAKYGAACEAMAWPLFVTLTRPNEELIAQQTFRSLRQAFGRLRHRKLWKRNVVGGIAGIEVTNIGHGWHPHLHCLVDCRWLASRTPSPQRGEPKAVTRQKCCDASDELGLAWARALRLPRVSTQGGGAIFKVKRTTGTDIVREVLKYSIKMTDLIDCAEPIGDVIRAMQGCRLTTSFGSLFGKQLVIEERPARTCACVQCAGTEWVPEPALKFICR